GGRGGRGGGGDRSSQGGRSRGDPPVDEPSGRRRRHRACRRGHLVEERAFARARGPAGHLRGHDGRERRAEPAGALREAADDTRILHGHQRRAPPRGAAVLRGADRAGGRSHVSARRGRRGAAPARAVGSIRQDRPRGVMRLQRVGVSLFGLIAIVSIVLAAATVWLFLTNPVTVANAVNEGEISPLVRNLGQVIYQALAGILKYL